MPKGLIPENVLEDILSKTDIVEIVSGYIPVKKAGRNLKALCPFHHEKTPSFMVSGERQIYHCFGCGAGGNVFNFLMQYERMDFPEAVEFLARKAGVALPERQPQDTKTANLITQLFSLNEQAASFYQDALNSTGGLSAKLYLAKRGLKEETIKTFKLGAAPDRWDALVNTLRNKGTGISVIEKSGLVCPRESGGFYDRFRNRLIFPIFDIKSRVMGFGARVLDNTLPKYINSPESPVYSKGKNLYGLNFSKDAIREQDCAVIVEGYLDFIIPFQEGFRNIAASLGTALTSDQARLLKRYTRNVIMLYDADKAGEIATLRSLDIFIEEDMDVRVVSLSEGLDPDLFVRKYGINNLRLKINQAQDLFDYKLAVLKSRYNPEETNGKVMICSQMLETISKFKNAVSRSEYVRKLSEALSVKEEALLSELKKTKTDKVYMPVQETGLKKQADINPTEGLLIKLMLEESDVIQKIKDHLEPADFQDERACRIVSLMFDLVSQGKSVEPNLLASRIGEEDAMKVICESAFMPEILPEQKEKVVADCIQRLKNEKFRLRRQRLHDEIKSAQYSGDTEKLNRLLEEFHLLIKKR